MGSTQTLSTITERNYIYALKVFAVVSIVAAHSGGVGLKTNQVNNIFSWILDQIGSIGVGLFFIVSGYLFYNNRHNLNTFFKKKVKTIFLPWIVTGTLVYLYVVLRKGSIGFESWINFLLGNGTYLYYLTLLITFYIIFFYTSKNKAFVYSTIILSGLGIVLTAMGVFEGINPFLNPLNFICYFSVGVLIASNNALLKIAYSCNKYKSFLLGLYIVLLILTGIFNISSGYFGYATLLVQPVAISLIFGLATMAFLYNEKVLELGIESFGIYLIHMPVAGIITFIFNHYDLWVLTLVRPIIVIAITLGFIRFYKTFGRKLKINNYTNPLIGTTEFKHVQNSENSKLPPTFQGVYR
jgi:peptidoglycan/LPS O-acetylase OafA/YrhL